MKVLLSYLTVGVCTLTATAVSQSQSMSVEMQLLETHAITNEFYQRIPLYRFSRNDNPSHFFTALESEKNSVISELGEYFSLEGASHYVVENHTLNSQPVYRMYNSLSGAHFYTASEAERDQVLANMSWFSLEGIGFYVFLAPEPETVPVYRFYVPQTGSHYFTIDEAEKNQLISSGQTEKSYDGIAWYAYPDNGLTDEVKSLISDEMLYVLRSMGMPINAGGTPPVLDGAFQSSPLVLTNTNIPEDYDIGTVFMDYFVQFSDQNTETLQIGFDTKSGSQVSYELLGHIVGQDSWFTVFVVSNNNKNGHASVILEVVSGKWVGSGIEAFHSGIFMLNDRGDQITT